MLLFIICKYSRFESFLHLIDDFVKVPLVFLFFALAFHDNFELTHDFLFFLAQFFLLLNCLLLGLLLWFVNTNYTFLRVYLYRISHFIFIELDVNAFTSLMLPELAQGPLPAAAALAFHLQFPHEVRSK